MRSEDTSGSRFTRWIGALAIAAIGLGYAGWRFGAPGVVLGYTALAIVAAIGAFWGSLRTLLGETKLSGADAYALGAPRVEEEQKRAVLRALKDLEFERSVGKISEEDYKVLVAGYRKEAKRLLRLLDEATVEQRARAEEIVSARLAELGIERRADLAEEPKPEEPKAEAAEEPKAETAEAPKAEAPKAEAAEEPKAEEPKAEEPKAEEAEKKGDDGG
ncbi:MAG: hypothetical protein HOV80_15570 [Polyangiaceae bacterium]|nr:hypothetical protein [Polyangiaceae bacterium]